jgi:hypothetical protein
VALLASIIPAAAISATIPPGLNRFLYALGEVESGGRYDAVNAVTGAYGKYQIMPANWPAWAKTYLGNASAPQTPANQEKVARGKVTGLWVWLDTWPTVAHWWLTGSGERNPVLWSGASKAYVAKIMKIYNATSDTAAVDAAPPPPPPKPPAPPAPKPPPKPPAPPAILQMQTRHLQETNASIAYVGAWSRAGQRGYAGGFASYAQRSGATATLTLTGRSVAWIGPIGQTRGRAQVSVDGKVVGIVDLRRLGYQARVTLFKKSWSTVGTHRLTIRVLGSGRPVAIDEFVVTR